MRRCARLAPAFERLDDDHAPATARALRPHGGRFLRNVVVGWSRNRQQLASAIEASLAGGSGEHIFKVCRQLTFRT